MRTVADILNAIQPPTRAPLPAPAYTPPDDADARPRVGLAVASMKEHVTREGWDLFAGLEEGEYTLAGWGLSTYGGHENSHTMDSLTDARRILEWTQPSTVVIQDKREWTGKTAGRGFDKRESFTNLKALRDRPDVFKAYVLKDAHSDGPLHVEAAQEAGVHAWIVYYHPCIVARLAPFVRPEHLIHTYHTTDRDLVPAYTAASRAGTVISGALSGAYPLRQRLAKELAGRSGFTVLKHPGYGRNGCRTPEYLKTLSRFKVAVCTSSKWGYLLKKIVEGVACGCVVVTDLPADEVIPEIDAAVVRISPDMPTTGVEGLCRHLADEYDPDRQAHYARKAVERFNWRVEGRRLAGAIEGLRTTYAAENPAWT